MSELRRGCSPTVIDSMFGLPLLMKPNRLSMREAIEPYHTGHRGDFGTYWVEERVRPRYRMREALANGSLGAWTLYGRSAVAGKSHVSEVIAR